MIAGRDAAELYTTHGFPPELLETLAAEHNLTFDWDGFQQAMEEHGDISGVGEQEGAVQDRPARSAEESQRRHRVPRLRSDRGRRPRSSASWLRINWSRRSTKSGTSEPIKVVLDRTPFYGESGGQVGDTGELLGARLPIRSDRHAKGRRLHAARRPSALRPAAAGRRS